jgi:predicted membrane protein|tara:strand:- start:519 stop:887 length:369 start_codon:yes stop_codon:yes gene_type:complete
METTSLNNLSLRLAGVVVILAVLFVIDLNVDDAVNQLWLPLLLAAGAYLITLSLMAVAITAATLAFLHMELGATFWVSALAYPALLAVCSAYIGWVLLQRFRQRIKDTHEERWASRQREPEE